MGWLPKFLSRNKIQSSQQSSNNTEIKNTTVVQVLVEETIMAAAQWLIAFVNHTIQSKQTQQASPIPADQIEPVVKNQNAPLEELLSKFGTLIEQLYERDHAVSPLYERVNQIEAFLKQNYGSPQNTEILNEAIAALEKRLSQVETQVDKVDLISITDSLRRTCNFEQRTKQMLQSLSELEQRLVRVEESVKQADVLVQELKQANEAVRMLASRTEHLEKLLARFSVIPKLVEGNHRAIAALQNRVESSRNIPKNSLKVVPK